MLKPKRLKPGARIAVLSPSSGFPLGCKVRLSPEENEITLLEDPFC